MVKDLAVQPVRRERISQRVALEICRMIRDGNLSPGDTLPAERELAGDLGVSRASLREALRGLELAGIVETRHGGGTVVRRFSAFGTESPLAMIFEASHDNVSDLWEVRRIVEPALAERAAVRATTDEIDWLGQMLKRHEEPYHQPGATDTPRALDREFHGGVARLTGNRAAEQVIHLLNTLVHKGYRSRGVSILDRRLRAYESHCAIFESIRDRNPSAAREHMLDHLQEVEEFIFAEVIEGPNEDERPESNVDSYERRKIERGDGGDEAATDQQHLT
ncbi:MAG: FadR/GntR family transcriptional regulator [Thermomicrobiales bacterium]